MKAEDPRAVRSREALMAAARALLAEGGLRAVTHQRVAERAGTGRATVYRHWPDPEQLVQQVLADAPVPFFAELDGALRPWLCHELRRLADEMASPGVLGFGLILLERARWDDAARAQRDRLMTEMTVGLGGALEVAAARGEPIPEGDPGEVLASLFGPIFFRFFAQAAPVSDDLIARVVQQVVPAGRTSGRD